MFKTRFWPMTARPISPMSQLSFCIDSPDGFSAPLFRNLHSTRPPRLALLAKRADALGEIGRAKEILAEPLGRLRGLLPVEIARFRDEPEPRAPVHSGAEGFPGDRKEDGAYARVLVALFDSCNQFLAERSVERVALVRTVQNQAQQSPFAASCQHPAHRLRSPCGAAPRPASSLGRPLAARPCLRRLAPGATENSTRPGWAAQSVPLRPKPGSRRSSSPAPG